MNSIYWKTILEDVVSVVPDGHWITPPEVNEIAREVREAAERIRSVHGTATGVDSQLDASWRGNAKNIFDAHFNSFPREILAYANDLDRMADEILGIQVWVPYEG